MGQRLDASIIDELPSLAPREAPALPWPEMVGAMANGPSRRSLTVLIPAYNEYSTVTALIDKVLRSPLVAQVVIVDDGSTDATAAVIVQWLNERSSPENIDFIRHAANRGKGAAIRTGLALANGDVVLIQDADLEYDPDDYPSLVVPILSGRTDVVYGSRFLDGRNRAGSIVNRVCVWLLNAAVRLLYGVKISDEATCYKAFRTDLLKRLELRCERFEFCPEVTAKLCGLGIAIHEVPIGYAPRTTAEGKKIGWHDAIEAFWTLLWWRFAPLKLLDDGELADAKTRARRVNEAQLREVAEVSA